MTESGRGGKQMVREPAACRQQPPPIVEVPLESRTETGFRNNENPNLSVCILTRVAEGILSLTGRHGPD